jgi:diguanylate cyclase (GGDEF)-like protein
MDDSELTRLKQEFSALVDIGKALTSTLGRRELISIIMEKVTELLHPKVWSLLCIDDRTGDLVFEIAVSPTPRKLTGKRIPRGEGIAGWVAVNGEPILIRDVSKDARFTRRFDKSIGFETRSIICVPLRFGKKVTGVIEFVNSVDDKEFGEQDLELLSTVADFVAIAIENAKNFAIIQELVITDDLTGLYNTRHILSCLDKEVERAKRFKNSVSFIFLDIDRFKRINDTYGHLVGSKLISEVGKFINQMMRKTDMAARYGGDEFVIILPNTAKEGAVIFTEKLHEAMRHRIFLASEGMDIRITASFGVATYPDDADSKLSLVNVADKLMYQVKETTRDGVKSA